MLKIGILGITGYAGAELIQILLKHPEVQITEMAARLDKPTPISNIFGQFKKRFDMECQVFKDAQSFGMTCDLIFLALPHKTSMSLVPEFLKAGKRVVDLSADFRLRDAGVYSQWYHEEHTAPSLLSEAVYGLPELYQDRIKNARLIANPGCYPTTVILGCAPLIKQKIVKLEIIVDSKSGISGAGKTPSPTTHFVNRYENFTAYNIGVHRHIPEMEQELSMLAGSEVRVIFSPHLLPINRGMLSTMYLTLEKEITQDDLSSLYQGFYQDEPFIRILDKIPQTADVRETNYCDIWVNLDKRTNKVIIVSAIDNLTKGASGQAVQNMNIMYGWDETIGLV
ncbi:N-acetyl-gamma-glutamyl-phosphate reductase [Candidatus Desantisbacteria bacterium CG2_30_40_21]|uniref:N-acetyl-gamma-glutamyl-phosphate reductase n=5 Tax=unclassified Candidatus Desantisiibacteriota TaxID=3106372 RepID=A0A2M7JE37_9BACT|nr:MAG: N-acetyl-gamma-glutamyl-phosphate reductase [Candidatus Desantisbacteria bacterium CG2_30_40_21]PIP40074.1 MAG: N-acetyl-gamma-glutamyl-phosphate reductase [Candidatus Desantisbacteria bacterium CG23_combo_of_CG06-09_8_20_14_all_40_23]PIX17626.1 MAG: N-acetyl-gamma-glutamyl-phosphate reductase [Candidatus Desantisbacteria bacterium CG_4_8_14_3_um_filter_40_12]PIY19164.1 MAG: N-acetyl-gamma-glutamyl-phosphate reductase [Candidatus Desantisbacteria bacterium CG_4_10_14_3_um_filter_40_18]P